MAKSTVNKAGNYTKPSMRKAIFNRIKNQIEELKVKSSNPLAN